MHDPSLIARPRTVALAAGPIAMPPRARLLVQLLLVCAAVLACTNVGPAAGGPTQAGAPPSVTITAPVTGATVNVGIDVPVVVSATDSVGVSRVDLLVDGVAVDTYVTPNTQGQPTLQAELHWTPLSPGAHALTVTAYRPDGTASAPAIVAITVASATGVATPPGTPVGPTETAPPTVPPSLSPDPSASPSPTRRPNPTQPPTPSPTATQPPTPSPTETPQFVDLRAVSYFVRTGASGDRNYIFVDVVVRNNGNVRSGPYDVVISCRGSSSSIDLDSLGGGQSVDLTLSFPADGPPGNEYVGVGWVYVNTADDSHDFAMDVVTGDPVTGDPQLCVN